MFSEFRQIDDSRLSCFLASIFVEVGVASACLAQSRRRPNLLTSLAQAHMTCDPLLRWPWLKFVVVLSCWCSRCVHLFACTRVVVHLLHLRPCVTCSCSWLCYCVRVRVHVCGVRVAVALADQHAENAGAAEGSPSWGRHLGQDGGRGRVRPSHAAPCGAGVQV